MALLLKVAAAVVTVAGLVTLWRGTDPSLLTYGYTLMTVGAVFAGAGIVLFGLGEVAARIEALRAALAGEAVAVPVARSGPAMPAPVAVEPDMPVAAPAPIQAPVAPEPPGMAPVAPPAAPAPMPSAMVAPAAAPVMTPPAAPVMAAPVGLPPAPVPPTRESMGLRPIGVGAAAAVAATGFAVAAGARPAPAAEPPAPPAPTSLDASLDDLLADLRGAPKDVTALVADADAAFGEAKQPARPDPAADLDPLGDEPHPGTGELPLVADAGPPAGDLKSAAAPAARAEPAEADPLASLSQALENLTDEIAGGRRPEPAAAPVEPAPRIEPVLVGGRRPMPRFEPVETRLDPEPARSEPPRAPEDELADLIADAPAPGLKEPDRFGSDLDGPVRPEPVMEVVPEPEAKAAAEPEADSFLARLRRSMGGGAAKEADKPREEPALDPLPEPEPVAGPAELDASRADLPEGDAKLPAGAGLAEPAIDDSHLGLDAAAGSALDGPARGPATPDPPVARPAAAAPVPFSIEEEMERALMASLEDKPVLAAEPDTRLDTPPEPVRYRDPPPLPPLRPVPYAEPAPRDPAGRDPASRDPAMATLARDFPELGDLLAPRKASPADPADALIADLKGIFDGGDKAPSRGEPAFDAPPPPPPPRRPVAPLLREGVIAQIPFRLYGDGTIEADLPEGTTQFASLRDFRAHVGG